MARHAAPTPDFKQAPINEAVVQAGSAALNQLVVLDQAAQENAIALAQQLGYEGSLTVGALEDEIRFYQQRTVECLLETGKRLLLLKQMTPHGEFAARVEMLGFAERTARRFMQAAKKAGKSATVAVLANRAKDQKAFLELITHDDDVIDNLAEMDNFDRMSASQVRAAARQLVKDGDFEAEKRKKAEAERDAAEKKLAGNLPVMVPLDERITPFQLEITERQSLLEKALMAHHQAVAALESWWTAEVTARPDYRPTQVYPLPDAVRAVVMHLVDAADRTASLVGALQAKLDLEFGVEIALARQHLMRETGTAAQPVEAQGE